MGDYVQISLDQIESYSWSVRNDYGDKESIIGQCDYMCYDLKDEICKTGVNRERMSVEQRRIGPDGQENHYILVIDSECVSDVQTDVWVDMSLDQFCESNKESGLVEVSIGEFDEIDSVRVMDGSDKRRYVYMSVEKFLKDSLSEI